MYKKLDKNNLTIFNSSIFISISTLLIGLIVNRGFFLINSVVGNEYENIRDANKFVDLGRLGHRLLTPYLSKIFPSIFIFNIFIIFISLFIVAYTFQKKYSITKTFLLCTSFGTSLVVIFTLNFGNYPDPLTIFLFLLLYINHNRPKIFTILTFLLVVNNEIGIFLLPILFIYRKININKIIYISSSFIAYLIYRFFIGNLVNNDSSSIQTYLSQLKNIETDFYILFGLFSGIKFLSLFLLFSRKKIFIILYLLFYIFLPMNMAVDYSRYGYLLIVLIVIIIYEEDLLSKRYFNSLIVLIIILNTLTPKYYVWSDQVLYLRDSKIHFIDLLGKNLEERLLK